MVMVGNEKNEHSDGYHVFDVAGICHGRHYSYDMLVMHYGFVFFFGGNNNKIIHSDR